MILDFQNILMLNQVCVCDTSILGFQNENSYSAKRMIVLQLYASMTLDLYKYFKNKQYLNHLLLPKLLPNVTYVFRGCHKRHKRWKTAHGEKRYYGSKMGGEQYRV